MENYQREFIDLAIKHQALKFGEFTLKSGRISPYFFNAGLFNSGASLAILGRLYAEAIVDANINFDMIFGPAYKGIPLAATLAVALADQHQRDYPYAYNRKEAKDHGEGGTVVGAPLQGKILIVDDVISAGTATRETVALIKAAGAEPAAVIVGLNRQERGQGSLSAIQEIEQEFSIPVISIAAVDHIIAYLEEKSLEEKSLEEKGLDQNSAKDSKPHAEQIRAYRAQYGV